MDPELKVERLKGLGGSDAAPACGISPWKTPYQLWLEKRGEAPEQEDNERFYWGRTLEPIIRQRYADVTGRKVVVPGTILVHPKIPWMIGLVDGLVGAERVLECKTARSDKDWGEPGTAEIPAHYHAQCAHYMAITGRIVCDVAVLIGGNACRIYEVPADLETQELLIEREAEFWRMVQDGTPPPVTAYGDLRRRFGQSSVARAVQADEITAQAVVDLIQIREIEKRKEALQAVVMAALGEADTLMLGDTVIATWKAQKASQRLDAKALQQAHPELYQQFLKPGDPVRRLLIK